MPKDSLRDIRKRSEREYQDMVERIADRVWAILKQNARQEKERRGTDRRIKQ
jgi:hypothetical protein